MSHFLQKLELIEPDWPAPVNVKAVVTTRFGGVSTGPFSTLNLGDHVNDDAQAVATNRQRLANVLPNEPCWLQQVHGIHVVEACAENQAATADASFSKTPNQVSCVMTADCLPVLFCNTQGTQVAAAHAGWRGLLDGVLEASLESFAEHDQVLAWFGPAIGPDAFEVGPEVKAAFIDQHSDNETAFKDSPFNQGKFLADLFKLARLRLTRAGIKGVYGGNACTFSDRCEQDGQEVFRFFSYRRDGQTGRLASCIWFE